MNLEVELAKYTAYLQDNNIVHNDHDINKVVSTYMNPNGLSPAMIDTITQLSKRLGGPQEFKIGGSVGLKLNKVLDRPINDLDVITTKDFYNNGEFDFVNERSEGDSGHFTMGGVNVKCFKLKHLPVSVDVMYIDGVDINDHYEIRSINGVNYKVDTILNAIKAKKDYIHSDQLENKDKHILDLNKIQNKLFGTI